MKLQIFNNRQERWRKRLACAYVISSVPLGLIQKALSGTLKIAWAQAGRLRQPAFLKKYSSKQLNLCPFSSLIM
jgi:hypothetical protein